MLTDVSIVHNNYVGADQIGSNLNYIRYTSQHALEGAILLKDEKFYEIREKILSNYGDTHRFKQAGVGETGLERCFLVNGGIIKLIDRLYTNSITLIHENQDQLVKLAASLGLPIPELSN